jgi:hypothetical protein
MRRRWGLLMASEGACNFVFWGSGCPGGDQSTAPVAGRPVLAIQKGGNQSLERGE